MKTVANNDAFHGTWESLQRDLGKILELAHTEINTPTLVVEMNNRVEAARNRLTIIKILYPVEKPAADRLADIAKTVGGFKA